jgi:hypothetical protein
LDVFEHDKFFLMLQYLSSSIKNLGLTGFPMIFTKPAAEKAMVIHQVTVWSTPFYGSQFTSLSAINRNRRDHNQSLGQDSFEAQYL